MMENYDRTVELMDTAYESAGRGEEQFSKSQDTLQAKLNTLANTWEQFRLKFFNQDFFKNLVDNLNKLLGIVSKFDLKQVASLGLIGVTLGKTVISGFIDQLKKGSAGVQTAWSKFINKPLKERFSREAWTESISPFVGTSKEQRAKNVQSTLSSLGSQTTTTGANADLTNNAALQQKTLELNKQLQIYDEMRMKLEAINNSEKMGTQEGIRQKEEAEQELQEQIKKVDKLREELGYEKEITEENIKQLAQDAGTAGKRNGGGGWAKLGQGALEAGKSGLSMGLTTAITTVIATGDFKQALKTGLITMVTTAISTFAPVAIELLLTFLSGPAGIVVIGALIIAAAVSWYNSVQKKQQEVKNAELARLKETEKVNDELRQKQEKALADLQSSKNEQKNLDKNYNRYTYLSSKQKYGVLNDQEQTEMQELAQSFQETYPEIISSYDENTSQIEFNTAALENLQKTLEQNTVDNGTQVTSVALAQSNNYKNATEQTSSQIFDILDNLGKNTDNINKISENIVLTQAEKDSLALDVYNSSEKDLARMSAQDIFMSLSEEQIKQRTGFDDDFYSKLFNTKDLDDFYETLVDGGYAVGDFVEQMLQGAAAQNSIYAQEQQEANRNLIKMSYVSQGVDEAIADLIITDEMVEKTQDKIQKHTVKELIKDYQGIFKSDNETENYVGFWSDNQKNFIRDFKDGEGGIASLEGVTQEDIDSYWKVLGYSPTGTNDLKSYGELFTGANSTNLVEYKSLSDEIKMALNSMGITEVDWNDHSTDSDFASGVIKALTEYAKTAYEGYVADGLAPETIALIQDKLLNVNNELTNYTGKTFEQWEAGVDAAIGEVESDENAQGNTQIQQGLANKKEEVQADLNIIIDSLSKMSGIYSSDYLKSNFSLDTIQLLKENINKAPDTTDYQRKQLVNSSISMLKNYTAEQQQIFASIDLTQSYEELEKNKKDYTDKLVASGMSLVDACNAYEEYISEATKILSKAILGKEGVTGLKSSVDTTFSSFDEDYSDLFSALEEYYEEGELSSETYFKLANSKFKDYVKITEKGYEMLTEDAQQYYIAAARAPVEQVEKAIEDNKYLKEQAMKTYQEVNMPVGVNGRQSTPKITRDLIARYNRGELDYDTYKDMGGNEKAFDLIQKISASGAKSYSEYIEKFNEANAEMENKLYPEAQIQEMIALEEHVNLLTEDIDDLNEELEDLQGDLDDLNADLNELNNDLAEQNEELIENQKAVDDAYKAWQEAIHGTADFQSSIDGLVNYNNLLSETERNITKIKEGLEEIDSVNQGAQSLQQLKTSTETQLGQLGAQKQVIDNAMANVYGNLIANYGDFTQFDQNGMLAFDFSIEDADMPDALKEGYQNLIEQYNDFVTQKQDIEDQEDSVNKEYLEMQEQFVDARVTMEQKIIEVLKSQQQEEVDQVKEKYDALKEQDDEYIDALEEAIKKQRDLREQETKYEDLAQKQKKLSLMQRDTSGANQKDVQSLEDEIQEDRQDLLNDEVDNIIDSLKELYEKQTEARELEIQAMEETIEDMSLLNEMAQNIMAGFQNSDDIISWFVGNNAEVDDMTVNQTEQYINEVRKDSSQFLTAVAAQTEDVTLDAQNVADTSQEVFDSVSQGITDVGDVTQATAEKTAQEAIDSAREAYDSAVQAMNDTQAKIEETQQKIIDTTEKINQTQDDLLTKEQEIQDARNKQQSELKYTMEEMVNYSSSAMEEVAEHATNFIIEAAGNEFDFSTTQGTTDFLNKHGLIRNNEISRGTYEALRNQNAAIDNAIKVNWGSSFEVFFDPPGASGYSASLGSGFKSRTAAEDFISAQIRENPSRSRNEYGIVEHKRYAKGGLVNYTGPAWVDGTKSAPEAFLSAEDTRRIGEAAQILAQIPALQSTSTTSNISTTNVGDTTIEIHLNIDKIANDYDIDQMVNRLKRDIVDISNGVGSSVILKK